jgi:cob(I)alamin adenosyltransferase
MSKSDFYTGKGDRGDTARLLGEARVPKSSTLIEAVGAMDEATCALGVARALVQSEDAREALVKVQRHLYLLMSHLSAVPEARSQYPGLSTLEVDWLEDTIAAVESDLPQLEDFVLPGDSHPGAACHMARTVVRRAERRAIALAEAESNLAAPNLAYLNRLSSLLFVLALQEDRRGGQDLRLARGPRDDQAPI